MNDNIVGYELSENQKNLWNVSKNSPDFFYNQVILNVKSNLSIDDFLNALNVVIKNNDVLKFRLVQDSNFTYPFQIESTDTAVVWHEIELDTNTVEANSVLDYSYNPLTDNPVRVCFAKEAGQLKQVVVRLYSLWGDAYSCLYLCDEIGKIIVSDKKEDIQDKETIDYASFSTWQNDLINEPEREAIVFWKNYNYQLTNTLIPFSNEAASFRPEKKQIGTITGDDYLKIKNYCLTNNCQIKTLFLLNFISYLFQFSEDELTIGLSGFKREYTELDATLGLVSKNIPLKISKINEFGFAEAVKNIETQIEFVQEWSDFFTLNRGDATTRFSKTAYFNYCFEFIDLATTFPEATDLFEFKELYAIQDIFDLKISCIDSGNSFSVALYYNQESFNDVAIDIISGQFQKNYLALIDNTNFEISDIEKSIIESSNNTHANFQEYSSVVQLFEQQSKLFPDRISLFNEHTQLSYSELQTRSNQFKNYLIEEHNIKKGDAICIVGEGSEWLITCILGIIKAGAYYIPIDNKYPKDRIEYIINESNCKVLISDPANEIVNAISHIVKIDPFNPEIYTTERKNYPIEIRPEDLVYCIYTSGSTGNPKGCIISHSSLLNYIQWANEYYFEGSDCGNWGLITSISFDLTVTSIFTSLTRGKKLWLGDFKKDINDLLIEAFSNSQIDTLKLTPAHISLLGELEIKSSTIKKIICGGEKLLKYQVEVLKSINNEIEIYNEYGPTETTVGCSIYEVKSSNEAITIGKPIANTAIYILTDTKLYAPIGVSGEIFIGGSGLAQGYLNRLDLTTEKFIVNPFINGERLYKTGDIGRWLPDGTIEYLGRIDDQVKIRGYRIELGEIEQFISNQDFINQSVVIVKERENEKFLVAYYVAEKEIDKKVLQDNLKKVLPDYMAPSYYVQLETIPLTSNGKVDRKALPGIDKNDLIKAEYIAARTTEEALLVQIWGDILKHDSISIKDSFYNLGGDSIKSILVVSRLRQKGYSLKVDQILRNPVLENLAKLIESNTQFIDQAEVKGSVVLTPVQRDFFENETITNKNYFNQSVLLKSNQNIDPIILERCIAALVLHHDALRMVYTPEQGSWQQYNGDSSEAHYKINFYDLQEDSNQVESLSTIGAQLQAGLDINSGILFQAGHFRMSDGDRLALIIHHLVIDGISWRILLEDLSNLYEAFQNNSVFSLPLKTDSFQRWASLQQEYALSDKMQQERLYWEELSKTPIALLPNDRKLGEDSKTSQSKGFVLDAAITQKLQTQSHQVYNTEINDILLASLGLAIREVFDVEKTVVKMEGHGREDIIDGVDIGRTIGWFTSLYPFILDVSETENHVLISVKEALRKIPNKGIGYSILKYMDKDFSNELIPSIQFNYLGDFGNNAVGSNKDALFNFSSEDIGPSVAASNKQSEVLLDVNGMMVSGELSLSINYSSHAFSPETIEKLVISYENQLRDLIEALTSIEENHLTPSDLTFKGLAYKELAALNKENNVEDIYELSPSQQGMYYHWLVDNSSPMYSIQTSYRLHFEDLAIDTVKQAYEQLIKRYSILRTSFSNSYGGVPLQIVHKAAPDTFSYEQILEINDQDAYLHQVNVNDKLKGFDFETPALMRLKVLELAAGQYEFLWSYHHILMDGWCISIVINDFYSILSAIKNNQELSLPEPIKYSNYINWLSKIDKKSALGYWKNYLKDVASITQIPFQKKKAVSDNVVTFKSQNFNVEGELFQKINQVCQELEITPNTFIQGVWGYLLSSYNNTNDIVFGSIVSGRPGDLAGVENMIGLFMNMIPVKVSYSRGETIKSFLKKMHSEVLESAPYHYFNLSEVQSQSSLGMDLINNYIVFENYFIESSREHLADESYTKSESNIALERMIYTDQSNYDFSIIVLPSATSFDIEFKYNSDLFELEAIQNIVSHFSTVTKQFSDKNDILLEDITYLSEQEQHQLLVDFNATATVYPGDKTFVDLFEEQVARTPNQPAIVSADEQISYKELDAVSTTLSKILRKDYAIAKGDMIGVQLNRSPWSMISILAILKSGAVYIPIDSELPTNRKTFIAEDTALKLLITQSSFIPELDFYQGAVLDITQDFD
ncbi:non-ribosomal peptide synthase protein (TIGR01720 family)/amino acid adenylation domain-containing protein, partial [Flavobacterium araucananum]